ncbi:MAG: DUF3416 domain-containing protein [Chitinivibrionales bacterium]|nr:DUF3416 domain-containing protein [Chitinivibrionales bacterium]
MIEHDGRKRVIITNVSPRVENGQFPIKRISGESVTVEADIFCDGHDEIAALVAYTEKSKKSWTEVPMHHFINDRWQGSFTVENRPVCHYTIHAWIDHFKTWRNALQKKVDAHQDIAVDLLVGVEMIKEAATRAKGTDKKELTDFVKKIKNEKDKALAVSWTLSSELNELMIRYPDRRFATVYEPTLSIRVDRKKALFSTWYELFPRSLGANGTHGTFIDCEKFIPEIAKMGFDVLYFPPIHPIGNAHRKGKNNSLTCTPGDPGSPWAIGSEDGGHKAIHKELGTLDDFRRLVKKANEHGIEIALDIAFQCSPDHPYVKEHPEWFIKRPDGTIQYAENPPKKYEDIVPFNFECDSWQELWNELKSVFEFWIKQGVGIFRVDNPHTKSLNFWEWCINKLYADHPETLFLAEAFTRPKIMQWLAKLGYSQSYTYFTWRYDKWQFTEYLTELTKSDMREYFRPNFWPNTPDILATDLQHAERPAFIKRLILAATLSSNYGVYAPAFESCENTPFPGKEEYLDSEKYEIKDWPPRSESSLVTLMSRVNKIRKENPALQQTNNIEFLNIENDQLLCYLKTAHHHSNAIIVAVNMDSNYTQSGLVDVPVDLLKIGEEQPYMVHDLISDNKYIWKGRFNYIELNPHIIPAHIFRVHTH